MENTNTTRETLIADTLAKCPFCGGAPFHKHKRYYIACHKCDFTMQERPQDSLHGEDLAEINKRLVAKWNNRADRAKATAAHILGEALEGYNTARALELASILGYKNGEINLHRRMEIVKAEQQAWEKVLAALRAADELMKDK